MELDVKLTEDDVEDLLEALRHYEDHLTEFGEESCYTEEVLRNLESLRERLSAAYRGGLN